ncbi:protein trichome birefringence-like 23 [Phtheirospermum japonicum]|uniref:Protein trichome birefringence-like 23 n=1 Tax=Phtheirospermum japonicum TaxID=374723 RepID=A0A830BKH9_9LAMI|nr:protein trichome birefringence-like 23 [Phtheirospermum japonicum]
MVKKMVYNWESWWRSLQKNNYFVLKLGVSFLLVGLAFRLLYNRSSDFSPVSQAPFLEDTQISTTTISSVNSRGNIKQITTQEYDTESSDIEGKKCNLFNGDWVPYQGEPLYTNSSCSWIEAHQNCMTNGRPDKDYLYWRWKPRGCELARVDPEKLLELMRDKSWAFIGDSISRNHVQSFLCVLSTVEKAVEVYHDENYKSRKWVFQLYNFTVSVLWSPFLAQAAIFEDINGVSTSEIELHLDKLDKNWTDPYPTFDYTIFSVGKWFTKSAIYYENNIVLGSHNCPKRNLTELGFNFAYRKVIRNVFDYIIESNRNKGMVFFRTSTPDHFEGGEWFSGGVCKRKLPAKEGEFEFNELDRVLRDVEVLEFEKASVRARENGVKFRLLDVSPLSLLRPDGHPGPYRFFQPFAKGKSAKFISDCLHWCLPGPIDSWNDILMEMVVNS